MINLEYLEKHYPIIHTNQQGQKIYNPDFSKYFNNLNQSNYVDLAQKLAKEKSKIFRHIYIEKKIEKNHQNNKKTHYIDIMKNGSVSCAVFVSQVLKYYKLLPNSNATVKSLEQNLKQSGRKKVEFNQNKDSILSIPQGSVLVRANLYKNTDKSSNTRNDFFISDHHIGFYIGNQKAISNVVLSKSTKIKAIAEHNAIRDAPKLDNYDKIEIVRYYILNK